MSYKSKFDSSGESQKTGETAEKLFVMAANGVGWHVRPAPIILQWEHVDFIITIQNSPDILVEVKGRKKNRRADEEFNDEILTIEFKNVAGKPGWLYGAADWIAFERKNEFVIVERDKLSQLCKTLVNLDIQKNEPTLYCAYTRAGRKDCISNILFADIPREMYKYVLDKGMGEC